MIGSATLNAECLPQSRLDPEGRWPGHLHEWRQSAGRRAFRNAGCAFCGRQEACPQNCLRTTHPKLASPEEWDYATNDPTGITPDSRMSGSHDEVSWLCALHGPYTMEIRARANVGQNCRICSKEAVKAKRQATINERRRNRYDLANEVRKRAAEPPPDSDGYDERPF